MSIALAGNNPGGMNDGAWARAQPGYAGPNGRYAAFATLEDGVAAMRALLLTRYLVRGFDTPRRLADRWAPDADGNNSLAYARRIARGLRIGLDDRIAPADVMPLLIVQARIENPAFPARWARERRA